MGGAIEGEGLMILDLAVGERYSADVEESTKKSKPAYKPRKYEDLIGEESDDYVMSNQEK